MVPASSNRQTSWPSVRRTADDRERGVHKGEQIDYFSPLAGSKTAEPGTCGSTVPASAVMAPTPAVWTARVAAAPRTRGDGPIGVCTKYCDS